MRNFFVSVDAVGAVTVDSTDKLLGYGGEHNVAVLDFEVDEEGDSVFNGVNYYQVVFDDYISDVIKAKNGAFTFTVPQEAVNPPIANCQLLAVKLVDSEPQMIAKSEIFQFEVRFSKKGGLKFQGTADALDRVFLACSEFKVLSEKAAETASKSSDNAIAAKNACLNYLELCSEYADDARESIDSISDAAEVAASLKEDGGVCNALKSSVSGRGILRVDNVSPFAHNMFLSLKEPLLANGIGTLHLGGNDNCHLVFEQPITADGVNPSIYIDMDSSEEIGYVFPFVGTFVPDLYVTAKDGDLIISGTLTDKSTNAVYNLGDYWQVKSEARIYEIRCPELVPFSAYRMFTDETVSVYGKNLIGYEDLDIEVAGVSIITDSYGRFVLNGLSNDEVATSSPIFKDCFSVFLPAGTYTFSVDHESGTPVNAVCIRANNTTYASFSNLSGYDSKTFTLLSGKRVYLGFYIYGKSFENTVLKIQLENGNKATEFQAYKDVEEYSINNRGVVGEISSISSAVTIVCDRSNVGINLDYHVDINYAFQQLENAIKALGGTV